MPCNYFILLIDEIHDDHGAMATAQDSLAFALGPGFVGEPLSFKSRTAVFVTSCSTSMVQDQRSV
jgi:hypothetical protein